MSDKHLSISFAPDAKVHFEHRRNERGRMRWDVIADICRKHGLRNGAEIGVKRGVFTQHILKHVPGSTMIAVDPWAPCDYYPDWPHEAHFAEFQFRTAGKAVTVHRMTGHEAAPLVPDGSLDFVFIDADHSLPAVKQDIADWLPKVRGGGLVSGHDIDKFQVERAVREALPNFEVLPNAVWAWWKR